MSMPNGFHCQVPAIFFPISHFYIALLFDKVSEAYTAYISHLHTRCDISYNLHSLSVVLVSVPYDGVTAS